MSNSILRLLLAIIWRRRKILVIPPVLVTVICAIGALRIPRLYESSIQLYVHQNRVRDPLSNFMMQGNEDPLQGLEEIVYSTVAIDRLIDSLQAMPADEVERRQMVQTIRNNITVRRKGDETFTISYMSSDPNRALRGVVALTNIFLQMSSTGKKEESDRMVHFYTAKVEELRQKFEESQTKILVELGDRVKKNTAVSLSVTNLDQQIRDTDKQLRDYDQQMSILRGFKESEIESKEGRQKLYELQRAEAPYALELKTLLANYADVSQKYTVKHPEVERVTALILDLLERMRIAIGNEMTKLSTQLSEKKNQRVQLVDEMVKLSTQEQQQRDQQSDYTMYQKLYNEMKVKLEEAQMSRSFINNSEYQFTVLDPAYLPLYPSKPNRTMIVLGGFAVGSLIGIILTIAAELLDTTIRVPAQLELYGKPVIALLPDERVSKE